MGDLEELQTQLGTKTEEPTRTDRVVFDWAAAFQNAGITARVKKPGASPTDVSQWIVLPNGTFGAASTTIHELPPGVYDLNLTDAGIQFVMKPLVTDTLFDLGSSNSVRVIESIEKFWTKKKQYVSRGLVYKRGILLWGPPGSGKTATLTLLMERLTKHNGVIFMGDKPKVLEIAMRNFRMIEPDRPLIVVFEDIDEIINQHGEHDILAFLDGENQTDNVVSLATTNFPEELGPRIVNRPSRFDEVIKIGMPSEIMRRQYLNHLLSKEEHSYDVKQWIEDTDGLSIAHLKELVVAVTCLDQNYDDAIKRLKTMKVKPKSAQFEGELGFK